MNLSPIQEDFIHFLWRTKKIPRKLFTTDGREVEILDFGIYNLNAGPDFFNAKIKFENTVWAGNIEMHVFSRDWIKHGHSRDRAYDNVILHVVYEHDGDIYVQDRNIPTIALKGCIPKIDLQNYKAITESKLMIPCSQLINKVSEEKIGFWKHSLTIERLETKSQTIAKTQENTTEFWEETLYITLARYFGSLVNVEPFERLARILPLNIMYKNQNNHLSIDALIFGQSGMLLADYKDQYFLNLKKEYAFLSKKYELKHLEPSVWKFGRLRPPNFPTVRLGQFAALMCESHGLFSRIKEATTIKEMRSIFVCKPNEYWDTRYRFGVESEYSPKKLTPSFIDHLIINAVVPILFLYGRTIQNEEFIDKAIYFLEHTKGEKNTITEEWKKLGIKSSSAYDSQALIHLKTQYCDHFQCMQCKIGHEIFK
jgi:Protein of unknown function (DUF2851)